MYPYKSKHIKLHFGSVQISSLDWKKKRDRADGHERPLLLLFSKRIHISEGIVKGDENKGSIKKIHLLMGEKRNPPWINSKTYGHIRWESKYIGAELGLIHAKYELCRLNQCLSSNI